MNLWTEADIPSQAGRVALITGANSGLGLATAQALAMRGAQVILACRGADKARVAIDSIRAEVPDAALEFLPLDLSSLASVREAAAEVALRHPRLDLLINNAGIMATPYGKTRDGFELQFGTNHLGHFALTGLLLDRLNAAPAARVVTVSSLAHRSGALPLGDLNWERAPYSRSRAYGRSKLANLVFALELDRRLRQRGVATHSLAAHPGYSATNIGFGGHSPTSLFGRLITIGNRILAQPAALGALPTLYAATSADAQRGDYYGPNGPLQFRGHPMRVRGMRRAYDTALAAGLWERSEQMTGVRYDL
ncbi:MAG TPA: oxidoreductase [Solimonas sp.]